MKLYYVPGACSLTQHIILHEAGIEHELVKVDLKTRQTEKGENYLDINSKGYVPALQLDSGKVMTEGVVLSQYLADLKPEAGLLATEGEARYDTLSWLSFISTELHKNMGALFNPAVKGEWQENILATLNKRLEWLAASLGAKETLTGTFSVADAYLFTVLGWARIVGVSLEAWPDIQRYQTAIAKRPAVQAAMKAEGLI